MLDIAKSNALSLLGLVASLAGAYLLHHDFAELVGAIRDLIEAVQTLR